MEANPFAAVDGAVAAVQEVLESMLSKENLVRDQILALNMNPQMEISIPTLLSHVKLAEIGATPELVVAAATRSARLRIDDAQQMVRPLRGLPRPALPFRPVEAGHPPLIFDGSEGATLSSMPGVAQQAAPLRLEDLGTTTGQPPEDGRGKGKSWGDEDKGGWDKGGRGKDKGGWGKDKGDRGKGRGAFSAIVAGRPGHVRSLPIRPGRVRVVAGRLVPCDKRALQWSAR